MATSVPGARPRFATPNFPHAAIIPPGTRLRKGAISCINYKNIDKFGLACLSGEPHTLHEDFGDAQWKHAMNEEFLALQKNKMWHLVPRAASENLIACKWVIGPK